MKQWLGVDPGSSGGFALLDDTGAIIHMQAMGKTPLDVLNDLKAWAVGYTGTETFAVLERVQAYKGSPMGKSSCFTFGVGYGQLQMALLALEIPHELVQPQKWQKALGCLTGGDKHVSLACAQRLWPKAKITLATSDALLIAEFARRTHVNSPAAKDPHGKKESSGKEAQSETLGGVWLASEGGFVAGQGTAQSAPPRHGTGQERQTRPVLRRHRADPRRTRQTPRG